MAKNQIVQDAQMISLVSQNAADRRGFCEIWPNAKNALNLLKDMVKNPALKVIITTIISVGDAVSSRVCG